MNKNIRKKVLMRLRSIEEELDDVILMFKSEPDCIRTIQKIEIIIKSLKEINRNIIDSSINQSLIAATSNYDEAITQTIQLVRTHNKYT